jgi:N-acetylmuramoyl-L-alanine amidase
MRRIRKFIFQSSGHARDTLARIDARHRKRGLRCVGFHYVIREDGSLERGRPLTEVGAHCLGYNSDSVGICLCGTGTPTPPQDRKVQQLTARLRRHFPEAKSCLAAQLDIWLRDPLRLDPSIISEEALYERRKQLT